MHKLIIGLNLNECFLFFVVIFKVYDTDCNGKVSFDDMLTVLRDLTGQYMSEHQRKVTNLSPAPVMHLFFLSYALCVLCMNWPFTVSFLVIYHRECSISILGSFKTDLGI